MIMEAKDLAHFSDTSFLTNAQNMSSQLTGILKTGFLLMFTISLDDNLQGDTTSSEYLAVSKSDLIIVPKWSQSGSKMIQN